jgi:hypothetical protein
MMCSEEDSTYIQQEAILRQRYSFHELATGQSTLHRDTMTSSNSYYCQMTPMTPANLRDDPMTAVSLHDPHGYCPSSWHAATDRHSPVFPISQLSAGSSQHYKQLMPQYTYVAQDSAASYPYDGRVPVECSWYPAFCAVTSSTSQRMHLNTAVPSEQICYPAASECLKSMVINKTDRVTFNQQFYDHSSLQSVWSNPTCSQQPVLNGSNQAPINNTDSALYSIKNNNYYFASNCCYGGVQGSMPYPPSVSNYHDNYLCQLPAKAMTVNDS